MSLSNKVKKYMRNSSCRFRQFYFCLVPIHRMPEVSRIEFLDSGDIGITRINPLHGIALAEIAGASQSFVVLRR